jgi:hypothetical protein
MNTKSLTAAALLIAGLAAAVNSARAQTPAPGDLLIGFQASSGTGATTNIEVDLGAASNYATAGVGTYNIANLNSDLTSTYGSWTSDSNLSFAIIGSNLVSSSSTSGPKKSLWASGAIGSPYTTVSPSGNGSANSAITSIYNDGNSGAGSFGDFNATTLSDINGTTATVGSNTVTLAAISSATANGASFTGSSGASGNWFIPNVTASLFTGANVGSGSASTEVFYYSGTAASGTTTPGINTVGTLSEFTLASNGELSFTVVPEPSTYAALIGVAALGYSLMRRRKVIA